MSKFEVTKQELSETVDKLSGIKGRQTELITVYISAGYDVNAVQRQLEAEKSTAKNIKSTATRKNVGEALDKIVRYLKELKQTPAKGLAIFCGNVSQDEGQTEMEIWMIEPPEEVNTRLYRCDKEFVLEPLKKMLEFSELYGLVVMDRREATIGLLKGKKIEVLQHMTSGVPSKVRAGGQCLSPDTSVVEKEKGEIKIKDVEVGDSLSTLDSQYHEVMKKWGTQKSVILTIKTDDEEISASPDHIFYKFNKDKDLIEEVYADSLKEGDFLVNKYNENVPIKSIESKENTLELVDLQVVDNSFLANGILVHNSSQRFHRITENLTKDFYKRIAAEMKSLFFEMDKLKGILVGGPIPTKDEFLDNEFLPTKLQELVIARQDLGDTDYSGLEELVERSYEILEKQEIIREKKLLENFFETLGQNPELAAYKRENVEKALQFGAVGTLLLSDDLDKETTKELKEKAKQISSTIEIISDETEEGKQFKNLSGYGAILRFAIGKE